VVEVALRGVTKRWGSFTAVSDLTLDVANREFLVLLGPSGCGKSTTLRMIAGLEPVSAGDIYINGEWVNDQPARDRDIAMVFQNYGLYPHFTVAENIAYPLRVRKIAGPDLDRRVAAAAEKVHLSDVLDRRPKALSGGQRQRVALARALVRTPNLFLMDEPLSNLDATLRVLMRTELKRLHHDLNTTIIYVTHDQIEAMTLATRVAVINAGVLVQAGTPEQIYGDPDTAFVAKFIGSPPMNLLQGKLRSGALEINGAHVRGIPQITEGPVVVAIRADRVTLTSPSEADLVGPVFAVEYTGSGLQVTVSIGQSYVTAVGDLAHRPSFDEIVGLQLDRSALLFFDAETSQRIRTHCQPSATSGPGKQGTPSRAPADGQATMW
jgi:multiple sugar transport system ATP-binding protein